MIKIILLIIGLIFVLARFFRRSKNKFSTEKFISEAKKNPETADEFMETLDFPYKSIHDAQIDVNELSQKIKTAAFTNYSILEIIPGTNGLIISAEGKYITQETTMGGRVGDVTMTRYDLFAIRNIAADNKVTIYGSMYETAAEKNVISVFIKELETITTSSQQEVILDLMDKMKGMLGE